jgi:hypothetical protein
MPPCNMQAPMPAQYAPVRALRVKDEAPLLDSMDSIGRSLRKRALEIHWFDSTSGGDVIRLPWTDSGTRSNSSHWGAPLTPNQ